MRSPEITRLYLQCAPDEDLAAVAGRRIWEELQTRLSTRDGRRLNEGPILQKGSPGCAASSSSPCSSGRLYLAGDAAHIVPPTGAKGLNLAVADVRVLADGFAEFYRSGTTRLLDRYSEMMSETSLAGATVLAVDDINVAPVSWQRQFRGAPAIADLDYLTSSRAAAQTFAENYVGLPMA